MVRITSSIYHKKSFDPMRLDGKEARVVMQQAVTDLDQVKRSSSPNRVDTRYAGSTLHTGNQLRQDLRRWLSPPDPSTNHNIACSAHHQGTTTWFSQGSIYSEWKSTPSLLWIHGKRESLSRSYQTLPDGLSCVAGSGKSILWFVDPLRLLSKLTEVVFHSPVLQLSKISK